MIELILLFSIFIAILIMMILKNIDNDIDNRQNFG